MKNGINQTERKLDALDPQFVVPDERSMLDLVQFTMDYAESVVYYNLQNKPAGNWKPFLLYDPVFIVGLIARTDLDAYKMRHDDLVIKLKGDSSKGSSVRKEISMNLLSMIRQLFYWESLVRDCNYDGALSKEIINSKYFILPYISEVIPFQESFGFKDFLGAKSNASEAKSEIDLNGIFKDAYKNIMFIVDLSVRHFEQLMNQDSKDHNPHIGLILAVLRLFSEIQNDLNRLTRRHLNFYYQKILEQSPPSTHPMEILVGLLPKPALNELPVNSTFNLNFQDGKAIPFKNQFLTELSQGKISEVRSLYKSKFSPFSGDITAARVLLSEIFDSTLFQNKGTNEVSFLGESHWDFPMVMGEDQSQKGINQRSMQSSLIGIMVTSPTFLVENGVTNFEIAFNLSATSCIEFREIMADLLHEKEAVLGIQHDHSEIELNNFIQNFLHESFSISITGSSGWYTLDYHHIEFLQTENKLLVKIQPEGPAEIPVPYDGAIHGQIPDLNWPCLQIQLNNSAHYPPYAALQPLEVLEVEISTHSRGVRSGFDCSNQVGKIDTANPFQPFGPIPQKDSFLRINNPLIFNKYLSELSLKVHWLGLPEGRNGFKSHYAGYPDNIDNDSFIAEVSLRPNHHYSSDSKDFKPQVVDLFHSIEKVDGTYLSKSQFIEMDLDLVDMNDLGSPSDISLKDGTKGDLTIRLVEPNPFAFGHESYPQLFSEISLFNSKHPRRAKELPKTPYTPLIENIEFKYSNYTKENLSRRGSFSSESIKLFHLQPFGFTQVYPASGKEKSFFVPQEEGRGSLLIGLTDVEEGQNINIGFKLHPAYFIHTITQAPQVTWEYLENNSWVSMKNLVMEDSTKGMLQSGLVKIKLPGHLDMNSSRMPKGKFWIRVSNYGSRDINSRLIRVFTNAVWLTQEMQSQQTILSADELKSTSTVDFKGVLNLNGVLGPYDIKFSKVNKDLDRDSIRVSELLRHRNRGITTWDLERLVLEHFPQIGRVLVYGRSDFPLHLVKNCNVQVVVIPYAPNSTQFRLEGFLAPFELLKEIKSYLKQFLSPFSKLEVANPVFEKLKIRASVKFIESQKSGYYRKMLERDLIEFLSPNPGDFQKGEGFINSIYKIEIQNFIESRTYVEYVTGLSVLQLVEVLGSFKIIDTASDKYQIERLRTISPYAILTSSESHQLEIIYENEIHEPDKASIGDLSIDSDFIINQIN